MSKDIPQVYKRLCECVAEAATLGLKADKAVTIKGIKAYSYRSIEQFLSMSSGLLPKHGLALVSSYSLISHQLTGEYWQAVVQGDYTLHCADDGSSIILGYIGEALDKGDKAIGKAQTYALKKAIEQLLMVPFEGQDPDEKVQEPVVLPPKTDEAKRHRELRHKLNALVKDGQVSEAAIANKLGKPSKDCTEQELQSCFDHFQNWEPGFNPHSNNSGQVLGEV